MRLFSRTTAVRRPRLDEAPRAESPGIPPDDDLRPLLGPISQGSRDAFRTLVDQTSGRVRARLKARLPDERLGAMVFAATYVEVWWLVGCHNDPGIDVLEWINDIVDRRVDEALAHAAPRAYVPDPGEVDTFVTRGRWAVLELGTLLGRPAEALYPRAAAGAPVRAGSRGMSRSSGPRSRRS